MHKHGYFTFTLDIYDLKWPDMNSKPRNSNLNYAWKCERFQAIIVEILCLYKKLWSEFMQKCGFGTRVLFPSVKFSICRALTRHSSWKASNDSVQGNHECQTSIAFQFLFQSVFNLIVVTLWSCLIGSKGKLIYCSALASKLSKQIFYNLLLYLSNCFYWQQ